MKISERMNGEVVVLELSGDIQGGPDSDLFRSKIAELIEKDSKNVVLDLSGVPWMNSTGVGIIVSGFTSLGNAGGAMKLLNLKERVKSILMVTKLLSVFESYYTEEEAVASFKKESV